MPNQNKATQNRGNQNKAVQNDLAQLTLMDADMPPAELPARPPEKVWGPSTREEAHSAMFIRGTCPRCGLPVVSSGFYLPGKCYHVEWECWGRLEVPATCNYWVIPGSRIPESEK